MDIKIWLRITTVTLIICLILDLLFYTISLLFYLKLHFYIYNTISIVISSLFFAFFYKLVNYKK